MLYIYIIPIQNKHNFNNIPGPTGFEGTTGLSDVLEVPGYDGILGFSGLPGVSGLLEISGYPK